MIRMSRHPQTVATRRSLLIRQAAVGTAVVAIAASCAFPHAAFATYKDVSDEYPALQDVSTAGAEIAASQIPDGTYPVDVSSSSYMCRFTDCTLAVKGGKMAVTFTMSKAYTRIYLGTAEEAAKHTNADGTDDSAYYKGSPADGYVYHVYTLPVTKLNHKMALSTYAGGTKTRKWFTRTVSFNSTPEIEQAIANGKSSSGEDKPKAEDNKKQNGGGSKSASVTGSSVTEKDQKRSESKSPAASREKNSAASSGEGSVASAGGASGAAASGSDPRAGKGSSGAGNPGSGGDGSGKKAKDKAGRESEAGSMGSAKQKSGPHVVAMVTPAQAAAVTGDELPNAEDDTDDSDESASFTVALGVVAAALAALVAVLALLARRIHRMRASLGRKD